MPDNPEEEDYFLPLEDQRVFGAGIRRKRVPFVRSSDPDLNTTDAALCRNPAPSTSTSTTTGATIANKYLSIVLSKSTTPTPTPESTPASTTTAPSTTNPLSAGAASLQSHPAPPTSTLPPPPLQQDQQDHKANSISEICEICNLPLTTSSESASETSTPSETHPRPHEASLAHQLCLTHSHPPSHLDRTRHGLRYLAAYGWDPDSRVGLGAPGREGIRAPVKGKVKADTVGLGVAGDDSDEEAPRNRKRVVGQEQTPGRGRGSGSANKMQKLNAKEVRRGQAEARKRGERLRELFYQDERVLRYLGEG